jgi:hypothetical protein
VIGRIKFNKRGQQRKFMQEVIERINCPSLRELINRGIEVNYSTLKNYFNEDRLMPENIFNQLIEISGMNENNFNYGVLNGNWGQVKGGKISRK